MPTDANELDTSIRRDLAWSKETGAPPFGHLAGLHRRRSNDGRFALELDRDRPFMVGGAGILEYAMLADLALGGAIRDRVGPEVPMPTISLTIQLSPGRTRDVAWADAECTVQLERTATAHTQLRTANGVVIGDAIGVFALPPLPYDGPGRALPWDLALGADTGNGDAAQPPPGRSFDSSQPGIDALVERIRAHACGVPEYAWGTIHVAEQLAVTGYSATSSAGLALTPTEPMANRLGHIQGGALFTTAVVAAARVSRFPVETLVTGTIEFMDAADIDGILTPEVTILRAGGRSLFAGVRLVQGGRDRCQVTTVFRR